MVHSCLAVNSSSSTDGRTIKLLIVSVISGAVFGSKKNSGIQLTVSQVSNTTSFGDVQAIPFPTNALQLVRQLNAVLWMLPMNNHFYTSVHNSIFIWTQALISSILRHIWIYQAKSLISVPLLKALRPRIAMMATTSAMARKFRPRSSQLLSCILQHMSNDHVRMRDMISVNNENISIVLSSFLHALIPLCSQIEYMRFWTVDIVKLR